MMLTCSSSSAWTAGLCSRGFQRLSGSCTGCHPAQNLWSQTPAVGVEGEGQGLRKGHLRDKCDLPSRGFIHLAAVESY